MHKYKIAEDKLGRRRHQENDLDSVGINVKDIYEQHFDIVGPYGHKC